MVSSVFPQSLRMLKSRLSAHGSPRHYHRLLQCTRPLLITTTSTLPPAPRKSFSPCSTTTVAAFRRLASSSTTPTVTRITHNPTVNPPASTLPPPLVLPTRKPAQSAVSYYFALGRAYLSFYKNGLKAVYGNWRDSSALIARLPPSSAPTSVLAAVRQGLLTRGEWLLVHRSRQDVARIPLFALVFMVCGEFTPFVVVFMSGVVPRTCRVPQQVQRERAKLEERRQRSFREGMPVDVAGADVGAGAPASGGAVAAAASAGKIDAKELAPAQVLHVGRSLGLYARTWDRLGGVGLGVPTGLVRARVQRRMEYLEVDDFAIERDGGVDELEMEEVRIALEERGLDSLDRNDAQARALLRSWLRARATQPMARLVLTRPSVWADKEA